MMCAQTRIRVYPSVVRTIISPILHKVRFVLGFVTSSQLVTRLNSSDRSTYLHSDFRPHQNIISWIERRLQAGMAYPFILEECKTMKQGVSDENGDTIMDVLEQFGLAQSFIDGDHSSYHLVRKSSHSPSPRPKLSPKWFSHKRAHSSLSKVDCPDPYQRPSLSAIHSHNGSATLSRIPYSNSSHSPSSSSLAPGDDVYTFLGCANISEARSILLWRLLDMRYHGLEEGWFLGGRREQAEAMLDPLERNIVNDLPLRVLFHFLRLTFHLQFAPTAASKPDVSSNWLSGGTFHTRDVSFDLEQYLRDISQPIQIVEDDEEDGKQVESHYRSRCSTLATMSSVWTSESQIHELGRRASSVSTFTIRQAVRRDTIKTRATEFSFPKKEVKMPKEDQKRQSKWTARSVSNFKKEPSYIRLSTKFGLGRSTKLKNSADQLAEGLHNDTSVPLSSQPSHPSPTPSTTTTLVQSSLYQNGSLPNTPTLRNPPLGRNRRQLHRQCAILDGERSSPSKSPDFHSSGEISPDATSFRSTQFARMNPFQAESSIPEDHGHSSGLSPITTCQDSSPVPLSSILKLFWDLSNGRQLEPEEVEDALMRFVASERRSVEDKGDNWDEGARCRVEWLIEQVAVLVSTLYCIQRVIQN